MALRLFAMILVLIASSTLKGYIEIECVINSILKLRCSVRVKGVYNDVLFIKATTFKYVSET